jgi:hypothetical protein
VRNPTPYSVRGCLFVGKDTPNDYLLFVFRRRNLRKSAKPTNGFRVVGWIEAANAAPPKNKKEEVLAGGYIYKRATPNGVFQDSRRLIRVEI